MATERYRWTHNAPSILNDADLGMWIGASSGRFRPEWYADKLSAPCHRHASPQTLSRKDDFLRSIRLTTLQKAAVLGLGERSGQTPRERPTISFMISVVPP